MFENSKPYLHVQNCSPLHAEQKLSDFLTVPAAWLFAMHNTFSHTVHMRWQNELKGMKDPHGWCLGESSCLAVKCVCLSLTPCRAFSLGSLPSAASSPSGLHREAGPHLARFRLWLVSSCSPTRRQKTQDGWHCPRAPLCNSPWCLPHVVFSCWSGSVCRKSRVACWLHKLVPLVSALDAQS